MTFNEKVMKGLRDEVLLRWYVVGVNSEVNGSRMSMEISLTEPWPGEGREEVKVGIRTWDGIPSSFNLVYGIGKLKTLGEYLCPEGCLGIWEEHEVG